MTELPIPVMALASTERLLVCCDFDGTLSVIVDDPGAARPVQGAIHALESLAAAPATWVAIVSGRALIDLTRLTPLPTMVQLVGSHGAEFEVGSIVAFGPRQATLLDVVAEACARIVQGVSGVLMERKPASVAVHVRRVDSLSADRVVAEIVAGPGSLPGVHVLPGKGVIELAAMSQGKGDAVDVLRQKWSATAVLFVGDDLTDEDAFAALLPGDVGIKVGPEPSTAGLHVSDPQAVVVLLEALAESRSAAIGVLAHSSSALASPKAG